MPVHNNACLKINLLFISAFTLYVMQVGEIATLKQDLKKQQEQTEKWVKIFHSLLHIKVTTAAVMCNAYFMTPNECLCYVALFLYIQENDCMALELKYTDAQQKKEEAENNLTKRVWF